MADFNLAICGVLKDEGGYVNDPADSGGETKYGISKASYPNVDIANLTVAAASAIYQRDFWLFSGISSQAVANKMFNEYVNMRHDAIKLAQRIVGVNADGSYGPHTEAAINAADAVMFLSAFRTALVAHYSAIVAANPSEAKFLNNWLARARE